MDSAAPPLLFGLGVLAVTALTKSWRSINRDKLRPAFGILGVALFGTAMVFVANDSLGTIASFVTHDRDVPSSELFVRVAIGTCCALYCCWLLRSLLLKIRGGTTWAGV